ncbi:MAG: hypothetical protein WB810_01740 [Candidatus Cybelea sp.]
MIIGLIAIALCAACNSNRPGSAIPISPADHRFHHLSQSGVVVDPSQVGAQVSTAVLGADMEVWFNITQPNMYRAFVKAGLTTTRWPGGKAADRYHWETNTDGPGICGDKLKPNQHSTFDNFMNDIALPAHLDVSINVNYGSNAQCTGGGKASEAAAWVKYANQTKGYNVTWWTVGNEQSVKGSLDLRSKPHDPSQSARIFNRDYYPKMTAASPIPINVCVDGSIGSKTWSQAVFSLAKFDCVEVHFYPQKGTDDLSDSYLIEHGPVGFTEGIGLINRELAAAGRAGTPIFVGEIGSATAPGDKQEMSITQALYAGQIVGEMLNDGIARATWHAAYGDCQTPAHGGDFSPTLYGFQNYGGSMIFSVGTVRHHCSTKDVPLGTLMPTAVAYEVASHFVRNGEHMLGVSVAGMPLCPSGTSTPLPCVRAYATTYNGGYALMLFNLNEKTAYSVPVTIDGKTSGSGGPVWWYDKLRYKASRKNEWKGPKQRTLPSWQNSFTVQLPPWSMTVVQTM